MTDVEKPGWRDVKARFAVCDHASLLGDQRNVVHTAHYQHLLHEAAL